MMRRQPLPHVWMMTDERQGDALWAALDRLPRGAGVVFRHYALPLPERRRLLERVSRVARRRRLMLIVSDPSRLGPSRKTDGVHNHPHRSGFYAGLRGRKTASAHNMREVLRAVRDGADLVFLSPVYPTRSHPAARSLGPLRFGLIARKVKIPVVALGGMTEARGRHLKRLGAYGWAGIDAWTT